MANYAEENNLKLIEVQRNYEDHRAGVETAMNQMATGIGTEMSNIDNALATGSMNIDTKTGTIETEISGMADNIEDNMKRVPSAVQKRVNGCRECGYQWD